MNWDAISTITDIVGALAVVVTLWYLALQMRQGNRQAYADNLQAALNRWVDIQGNLTATTEDAELFRRALNDYHSLSSAEKATFSGRMLQMAACFHTILVLHERGLWDAESFDAVRRTLVAYLKCRGVSTWWQETKSSYPRPVVEYLDRAVEASNDPPLTQVMSFFRKEG